MLRPKEQSYAPGNNGMKMVKKIHNISSIKKSEIRTWNRLINWSWITILPSKI